VCKIKPLKKMRLNNKKKLCKIQEKKARLNKLIKNIKE